MYLPVIEEDKCTNCQACARICPKLVFEPKDDKPGVANPIYCTGCESCSAVCPMQALKVEEI
jgi:NAD-dependent dihydropyrimidine dehydrogenase PreA subunit